MGWEVMWGVCESGKEVSKGIPEGNRLCPCKRIQERSGGSRVAKMGERIRPHLVRIENQNMGSHFFTSKGVISVLPSGRHSSCGPSDSRFLPEAPLFREAAG